MSRNVKPSGRSNPAFWGFWGYTFREAVSGGPSAGRMQRSNGPPGPTLMGEKGAGGCDPLRGEKVDECGAASWQRKSSLFALLSEAFAPGSAALVRCERLLNAVLHRRVLERFGRLVTESQVEQVWADLSTVCTGCEGRWGWAWIRASVV